MNPLFSAFPELETSTGALPAWIAGAPVTSDSAHTVTDKYTLKPVGHIHLLKQCHIESAIASAERAISLLLGWQPHHRARAIRNLIQECKTHAELLANLLVIEVGKPITAARAEVTRAIDTLTASAEEAIRITGSYENLAANPRGDHYLATIKHVPVGICAFITPFNFPFNLAIHKIGPAMAAGCPFLLKPALNTPLTSIALGSMLSRCNLPEGTFSILNAHHDVIDPLITDDRIAKLSFTGSPRVGWDLKSRCRKKRITLELGGNAACIIDEHTDLNHIIPRIINGAFAQAGQSCISVQRVLVHDSLYNACRSKLINAAQQVSVGNPAEEQTVVGPMIDPDQVTRIHQWVQEAIDAGATLECGGIPENNFYMPTVLTNTNPKMKVEAEEAFAPLITLRPFSTFQEALRMANDSRFGLQAGVFTSNLNHANLAFDHLEVGGVVINDVPTSRVDIMPYGGVKDSGFGREGVRFAIREMLEPRLRLENRAWPPES